MGETVDFGESGPLLGASGGVGVGTEAVNAVGVPVGAAKAVISAAVSARIAKAGKRVLSAAESKARKEEIAARLIRGNTRGSIRSWLRETYRIGFQRATELINVVVADGAGSFLADGGAPLDRAELARVMWGKLEAAEQAGQFGAVVAGLRTLGEWGHLVEVPKPAVDGARVVVLTEGQLQAQLAEIFGVARPTLGPVGEVIDVVAVPVVEPGD